VQIYPVSSRILLEGPRKSGEDQTKKKGGEKVVEERHASWPRDGRIRRQSTQESGMVQVALSSGSSRNRREERTGRGIDEKLRGGRGWPKGQN